MRYDADVSDESNQSDLSKSLGWQMIWAIVQLGALGVAAARIPLTARYSATGEQWAVEVMLVTQVGLSSMIFPQLLRGWRSTGVSIGISWVFMELAAFLTDYSFPNVACGEAFVTIWIFTLAIWNQALSSERSKSFAAAVATTMSFGGVGVSYLLHEFGSNDLAINWQREGAFGPVMGGISAMRPDFNWISAVPILILLVVGILAFAIGHRSSTQK